MVDLVTGSVVACPRGRWPIAVWYNDPTRHWDIPPLLTLHGFHEAIWANPYWSLPAMDDPKSMAELRALNLP